MKRRRTPEPPKPAAEPKPELVRTETASPRAEPGAAYLRRLGDAATEELRKTVRAALSELFQSFLTQTVARLAEVAAGASSPNEQRAAQDLSRAISSQVPRWIESFLKRVESHLIGGQEPERRGARGADDDIALIDIELRAELLYQKQIAELENRLNAVRLKLYVPIYTQALGPAGLCRSLQDVADAMALSAQQRRMLFEYFDELAVPGLQQLYKALLEAARLVGAAASRVEFQPAPAPRAAEPAKRIPPQHTPAAPARPEPAPAAAPPPPKPAPPVQAPPPPPPAVVARPAPQPVPPPPVAPPAPPKPSPPPPPPAPPPRVVHTPLITQEELERTLPTPLPPAAPSRPPVDSLTLSMLQLHAVNAATEGYNDGSLATDLLAIADNKGVAGLENEKGAVPLQRISLAGRFLNDAIADPNIPEELRWQHESVRFPMLKSALTDASMFTALSHPLGSLVNEMMLKSATSRITGNAEARRAAELLEQVIEQFDLSPEFVRHEMLKGQPIDEAQVKQFFERQKEAAQARRDTVIREVKLLVTRELDRSTFARGVPEPALQFLNTAWGPMLVKCLLQHGAEHASWKDGLAMADELLDALDHRHPGEPAPPSWQILMHRIDKALTAEGMTADRVHAALAQLEKARRAPPEM